LADFGPSDTSLEGVSPFLLGTCILRTAFKTVPKIASAKKKCTSARQERADTLPPAP